ncbi:MAG: winged helix-turn-helix domain-containing protein [Sphingobacteriia bacterium]|nr:winged helix-turn-helix domain-containing protein [Sphingobacteriia bacterium]
MVTILRTGFHPLMLIVDDKSNSLTSLESNIKLHGFNAHYESNAQNAMKFINTSLPNIVVISEKINEISAMELCYYVRSIDNSHNMIVMIIKYPGSMEKEISREQNGPDAYIVLDKDENDLIAKIKYNYALNRSLESNKALKYGDIEMNLSSYTVTRQGKYIKLGPTEFKILQCFLEYPKNILSREFLMSYVWGKVDSIEPRTIDVHINRLRNALKLFKDELPIIETIRSLGYCLRRNFNE